jgi:hypothetical protein
VVEPAGKKILSRERVCREETAGMDRAEPADADAGPEAENRTRPRLLAGSPFEKVTCRCLPFL